MTGRYSVLVCIIVTGATLAGQGLADPPLPVPKPAGLAVPGGEQANTIMLADLPPTERPETRTGESGLPVPRFVSLKSDKVFLRDGPASSYKVEWVYIRKGLPVEVIAEYDVWRRIRDADGVTGWVHQGKLDGRRSVLVTGPENVALQDSLGAEAATIAYAQPGVIARLKSCGASDCEVVAGAIDGYVPRARLWGIYEGEVVD